VFLERIGFSHKFLNSTIYPLPSSGSTATAESTAATAESTAATAEPASSTAAATEATKSNAAKTS
jgi:hypothetical protein